ncbi:T9SS type A sorting domain-containing protein [candidate division KSB1 bacterium]|nr:T9SS type A sorting domain-containing protein [candidate division KSB1 bacterium]NIR70870.1 T9SS type A sorting domain-containing protein [candidate division KSB1 bacterium]NIS24656.1 T9SS type A sorting domain-containing protein [candidate division KSB1 bacterium]NIT71558.1 T9SS type A sorting domain-containing protein [candidate division KSB1 bacterium]NIU25256.1 T9SS type A sorting domain-containing protein [candidate division KSB1 bacterium]
MESKQIFLYFFVLFYLFMSVPIWGQERIARSVFGNGGTGVSSSENRIVGTLGQPLIGTSSSTDNIQQAGFWYTTFGLITSVEQVEEAQLPTEFRLEQNYPNPFNPTTTIQFSVPKTSSVSIKLYDILGRRVATLVDDEYQVGIYNISFDASDLASGVYVYRIQADGFVATRKLMLLK